MPLASRSSFLPTPYCLVSQIYHHNQHSPIFIYMVYGMFCMKKSKDGTACIFVCALSCVHTAHIVPGVVAKSLGNKQQIRTLCNLLSKLN